MKDIVLIGAGHAHIEVLRSFGLKPELGARLTLVTRQPWTPYSGMLPGLIAGLYAFEDAHIDVRPLCAFAGARLILDEAAGIDLAGRGMLCESGASVSFDILSLDIGSTPNTQGAPGAGRHAVAVKPIDGFLARFEAVRRRVLEKPGKARIAVVGGGAAGVELALAMEGRFRRDIDAAGGDARRLSFALIAAEPDILTSFPRRMRRRFREILAARGIEVMAGKAAVRIEEGAVCLDDGEALAFDGMFWATQASAAPWLASTGLKLDAQGFIEVRTTLESVSHAGVFAAGDIACFQARPLPKAGVYAVREGPPLAANLRRAVQARPLKQHRPQRRHLSLISTGERYAIGARNGLTAEGAWVWRWKDWIDRRFMRRFNDLPPRPSAR
jgi:selenide, water dikinase